MTLTTLQQETAKAWLPPPKLTVSQWADSVRKLSPESSAEPGQWRTDRAPYQRGIMDAFNEPTIHTVTIMCSAQVGKTEILNNIVGYFVDQDPAPMLVLQPTLEMAQAWSKDRLAPMLRDTPALKGKVKDPRARDSGNTMLHKQFPGGHITMAGGNSPASLASRPIRIVLCDEVDRYPASAGAEGDPVNLARKRSTTFWNRKLLLTSTPTIRGISRIEAAFEVSDQRRYFVPCPHCQGFQSLCWANVKWEKDKPEAAYYECEHCHADIQHSQKMTMLLRGEWRITATSRGIAGFHLNEIYSPWVTWSEMVINFLEAKKLPETLKTWVNTSLGETWEETGVTIAEDALYQRREYYGPDIPQKAVILTAGVDVQNDRLEIETVAWGPGEESWSVRYDILRGNPAEEILWHELDTVLFRKFQHESGIPLEIRATCIDTGGHHTMQVYRYCKRYPFRVLAIKGSSQIGKPIVSRPTRSNMGKVDLYAVGTDTAKALIYSRLKIQEAGPGYCHFPVSNTLGVYNADLEYFRQLTAEKMITRHRLGKAYIAFEKPSGVRNEALDVRVYATAALYILNPHMQPLPEKPKAAVDKPHTKQATPTSTSWINPKHGSWFER